MEIITLNAPEGKVYTDGFIYGKIIEFKMGVREEKSFYLITEEEYNKIQEALESEV